MKDVIELAKQAGFQKFLKPENRPEMICDPAALERFATLVRNAALEEAAQACMLAMDEYAIRELKEPTP